MDDKYKKISLKERFVRDKNGNINPMIKYNGVWIKVLIGFNALELFGSIITGGDWGFIVFTNLIFLVAFLYSNKLNKLTKNDKTKENATHKKTKQCHRI